MERMRSDIRFYKRYIKWMLKRKLQDLTVCCTYQVNFLHNKVHGSKEFRRRYRLIEEMGRGGFGIVYEGERLSDGLPVAIKFIRHKNVREWTMKNNQLLPSELVHLETCRDVRGVIGLIDWFANSKGFLIVMERPTECMDLFDLISTHGRLDETMAQGIFLQIVDTVCSMYAQHGIVHRDIKDENLIVDMKTGLIKLVDFGAAALADRALKKEFQGTRSYCPPEWFRRLEYLPLEATSWSLGVLLYILLTGNLPFRNEIQICLGRINYPSYLSKEVISLLRRCLSTFPGNRASLIEIRQNEWLQKDIHPYKGTFKEALDKKLLPKIDRRSRRRNDDSRQASEERLLEKMLLSQRQPRSSKLFKSSNSPLLKERSQSPSTSLIQDESSLHSMHTCLESISTNNGLARIRSRYDNVSASSFADYMSIISGDTRADTLSMVTTCPYFSASEMTEDTDEDESGISDFFHPAKNHSTQSLVSHRKRSLLSKSFDRELSTLDETEMPFIDPMITSQISTTSTLNDRTFTEDPIQEKPSPISRLRPLLNFPPKVISRISLLTNRNNSNAQITAN